MLFLFERERESLSQEQQHHHHENNRECHVCKQATSFPILKFEELNLGAFEVGLFSLSPFLSQLKRELYQFNDQIVSRFNLHLILDLQARVDIEPRSRRHSIIVISIPLTFWILSSHS